MARRLVSAEDLARYILDVYCTNQAKSEKEILNLIIDTCHNTIDMGQEKKRNDG